MHPALSVIFFTTASGAGYGLLAWLGIANAVQRLPQDGVFALLAFVFALALVSAGLLSSLLHLGHPERAWRAFSQWRSSWLSREGVMAMLSFVPALVFGLGLALHRAGEPVFVIAGVLAALGALLTVFTTAMIYASLRTIAAWHDARVPPLYLLLALATGMLVLDALGAACGVDVRAGAGIGGVLLVSAALVKWSYWRAIDTSSPLSTAESATGLGRFGTVSQLQSPHERENFVLKEMGFRVARKHARKLRRIAVGLLFVVPVIGSAMVVGGGVMGIVGAWLALLAAIPGVVIERWLFFAEAKHVVGLYYGRA
jgi:DMSO reductase anchor subunit